jgi:hypothetical protein
VFLFRRVGRMGPLGIAFMAFRLWQRLSPRQKDAIRRRLGALVTQGRQRRSSSAAAAPSTMSRVGSATAPDEEIPRSFEQKPA